MSETTLTRIWAARETIARRCDFDSRKLVRFYQSMRNTDMSGRIQTKPDENSPRKVAEAAAGYGGGERP